jgi:hypothetical protein
LLEETPIRLHRTEQFCLFATLDVGVPSVADHPPRQELVVTRIKMIFAEPVVMREAVEELGIFENDGPVRSSPP